MFVLFRFRFHSPHRACLTCLLLVPLSLSLSLSLSQKTALALGRWTLQWQIRFLRFSGYNLMHCMLAERARELATAEYEQGGESVQQRELPPSSTTIAI